MLAHASCLNPDTDITTRKIKSKEEILHETFTVFQIFSPTPPPFFLLVNKKSLKSKRWEYRPTWHQTITMLETIYV